MASYEPIVSLAVNGRAVAAEGPGNRNALVAFPSNEASRAFYRRNDMPAGVYSEHTLTDETIDKAAANGCEYIAFYVDGESDDQFEIHMAARFELMELAKKIRQARSRLLESN